MISIEEKVKEHYKNMLDNLNLNISNAFNNADNKSGVSENNYSDI